MSGTVQERADQSGGRILVVDDEEKNRRLLTDLLSTAGYAVRTAVDGLEALQSAIDFQPETILLDIMMPKLDGIEVCRRLKADPATDSIPVLLATALHERDDRMRGLKAGANDFLTKPLDTEEVISRVKNAVHSKRLHDRLQDAYRELKKLAELRDNLTHMIVHDLRSPLTVMVMSLEMMLQELDEITPDQRSTIVMAQASCKSLIEMVSSLLDISRMQDGQMPLNRTACRLLEITREVVESMTVLAQQKKLTLSVTGDSSVCEADKELVRRIIVNLLNNAIKFSPAGTAIGVAVSSGAEGVRCTVRDSGPGIPPEYHKLIFEKFGQVESRKAGKTYSTGLGLAFCKLAVEAHGGRIGVVSDVGKGSTFWFVLPAAGAFLHRGCQ